MTTTDIQELLRQRARDLARPIGAAEDVGAVRQLMRFRLRGDGYALPLDRIRQVIPLAGLARLPRAAWPVVALTSVAGQIVPIIMPARSAPGEALPAGTPWGVAVEAEGTTVCFPADVVTGVVEVRDAHMTVDGPGGGERSSRGLTREGDVPIDVDAIVAAVAGQQQAEGRSGAADESTT